MAATSTSPDEIVRTDEKLEQATGQASSLGEADMKNQYDDEEFWTRAGLTPQSFQKRHYGLGIVEMDRAIKKRHLHMIAIGGAVGTGLFVGSGSALSKGGPASLIICFLITGFIVFNVMHALGELAVLYPISGGFYTYATRFVDPSFGFAVGWNYVFLYCSGLPLELTVCALVVRYWDQNTSVGVWITIFLVVVILVNVFGSIGFAEEEFWSCLLKLTAIVVFIIIALVLVLGGGPADGKYHEYQGAKLWYEPGAFNNGFKGFCGVFVTAALAYNGTELVGFAAAESRNPAKALPGAIKQMLWRITLFYILGLLFIGLLIPYNDPRLLSTQAYTDVKAAPFVLVGEYAKLKGFDHFINAIILISAISACVAIVYGGSRTLTAMAQQGYAPVVFSYIDRSGRPLASVGVFIAAGLLAYINLSVAGSDVFEWLQALGGLAILFAWGSICLAHIRFRAAWAYHGKSVKDIPFRAAFGVWGSWIGLVGCILVLAAQFYNAITAPIGKPGPLNTAEGFFQAYLAFPILIMFWVIGFLWKRTGFLRMDQIDIDSGRRELDFEAIHAYEKYIESLPLWRRVYHKLF